MIDLPETFYAVCFAYISGDRLYTNPDKTLFVYSLDDLTTPSATYHLGDWCYSALITDNRLFLGGNYRLHIFEVTPSLTEPLTLVANIPTKVSVLRILRVGDSLLLG